MTPDPIGLAGGLNLYGYAGQNPINYVDPLGLEKKSFGARWLEIVETTNSATFTNWGTRVALGYHVSKEFGRLTQSRSFFQWLRSGFAGYRAGAALLTGLEAGVVGLGHAVVVGGLVFMAYEGGIGIGAFLDVAYQELSEYTRRISQWPCDLIDRTEPAPIVNSPCD